MSITKKKLRIPIIITIVIIALIGAYSLSWLLFYQFVCKPHITDELKDVTDRDQLPFTYLYTDYEASMDQDRNHFYLTVPRFPCWNMSASGVSSYKLETDSEPIMTEDGYTTYPHHTLSGTPFNIGVDIRFNVFGQPSEIICHLSRSGDDNTHGPFKLDESLNLLNDDELSSSDIKLFNEASEYIPYYVTTIKEKFNFD